MTQKRKRAFEGLYAQLEETDGLEKPRDFDPFGQTGLSPLATI